MEHEFIDGQPLERAFFPLLNLSFTWSLKLPVPVSLTKLGYPRIFPRFHRRRMYRRDERADSLVQLYLSFFSLYRIILIGKKINKSTFESIVTPVADMDAVYQFVTEIKSSFADLIQRYIPDIRSIPLDQGMQWTPTWKALPSFSTMQSLFSRYGRSQWKRCRSSFPAQTFELAGFIWLVEFVNARGEQWNQGTLWALFRRFPFDPSNKRLSEVSLEFFEQRIGPFLPTWSPEVGPVVTGRLGQSIEGGGKRRIFAIGNYVNQRLLHPVHDWLSQVLKKIPQDGTYDQTAPLDLLVGHRHCFSFDLKSATDRWPLVFMFEMFQCLFGRAFASAVVNSALAMNLFQVPFVKGRGKAVSFVAGQPLGYHSSWPLFALTHHLLVWWCAEQVYPLQRFTNYAILGDDIVIADEQVARVYRDALSRLEVRISEQKSLISDTGCAEFAKRFRVKDLSVDLDPISARAVLSCHHPYGLYACAYK